MSRQVDQIIDWKEPRKGRVEWATTDRAEAIRSLRLIRGFSVIPMLVLFLFAGYCSLLRAAELIHNGVQAERTP